MTVSGGLPKVPNKLYFRIGEVSEITGVQPYTLRHWEMEFPTLNPRKNDAGQRLYRRRDIEVVSEIQRLLHHEGYTTAGARRLLTTRRTWRRPAAAASPKAPESAGTGAAPDVRRLAKDALSLMERNDRELARLLPGGTPGTSGGKTSGPV